MTRLTYIWNGEFMKPLPRLMEAARRQFIEGQVYALEVQEDRSTASHRSFFASVREAYVNMPESYGEQFPTERHLRKWCLIKAGYSDTIDYPCQSEDEARRLAAFIKPIDEYAIVEVRGDCVRFHRAKSQSLRQMDKATFEASQRAVRDILAGMIGVDPAELQANAGTAA